MARNLRIVSHPSRLGADAHRGRGWRRERREWQRRIGGQSARCLHISGERTGEAMQVRELIQKKRVPEVITLPLSADLATAAGLLMRHNIGGLPVVKADGQLVGFVSERDIVRAVDHTGDGIRQIPVKAFMRSPAPICTADELLNTVMTRMNRERLRHLVVVDGERVAGVLSVGDLVKHRISELETETGVLRDYVVAQRARS
jgi:CBS domain-containing protein